MEAHVSRGPVPVPPAPANSRPRRIRETATSLSCEAPCRTSSDGGVVYLDLRGGRVCRRGAQNAANLAGDNIDADADWFEGYPEWTVSRVEDFE